MARKGLDWQEKSVKMPDWTKAGEVYYWQNPDFDAKKPTLLMVHGFRGDHHGMQFIADNFADLDRGKYNIILLDLPAYGKTAEFEDAKDHHASHYANFLAAFLDKIKLRKPDVLGHSFGTTILSRLVAKYSDKIGEKVVFLSPIAKRPQLALGTKVNNAFVDFVNVIPESITRPIAGSRLLSDFVSYSWSTTPDRRIYNDVTKAEHRKYFGKFSSVEAMLASLKSSNTDSVSDMIAGLVRAKKDFLIRWFLLKKSRRKLSIQRVYQF